MISKKYRRLLDSLILLGAVISGVAGNVGIAIAGIAVYLLSDNIDKLRKDIEG